TVNIQVTANGCNGPSSQVIKTVIISPLSSAGSLTIDGKSPATNVTSVCPSPNSAQIDLSSSTGTVTWQQSTNGGSAWVTAIGTATQTTLTVSGISQPTIYRAVVQSGTCSIVYSSFAVISVIPPYTPSPVSASPSTICLGSTS